MLIEERFMDGWISNYFFKNWWLMWIEFYDDFWYYIRSYEFFLYYYQKDLEMCICDIFYKIKIYFFFKGFMYILCGCYFIRFNYLFVGILLVY